MSALRQFRFQKVKKDDNEEEEDANPPLSRADSSLYSASTDGSQSQEVGSSQDSAPASPVMATKGVRKKLIRG